MAKSVTSGGRHRGVTGAASLSTAARPFPALGDGTRRRREGRESHREAAGAARFVVVAFLFILSSPCARCGLVRVGVGVGGGDGGEIARKTTTGVGDGKERREATCFAPHAAAPRNFE
uniref:Uncharacterized protein n=1 Tax=Oryza sativa subsp. japonica TaxID=39947 RepID=Q7F1F0_ORYSJ|nr:hypothetical protein [Oryza sativa Japonica Group]BAD11565.1 hypothetical protein [Oryza sativa Japonica Group]